MSFRSYVGALLIAMGLLVACESEFGKDKMGHDRTASSTVATIDYLRNAISANPGVIENYLVLARLFLADSKYVQAEKLLETAYGRDSEHPGIIYLLSRLYLEQGSYTESLAVLKKAEQKEIQTFGLFKNFARVYYHTGEYHLMPLYVGKALHYDEDDWEMVFYKAEVARVEEEPDLAFENYEKAYQLHPSDSIFNSMYDYALSLNDVNRVTRYISREFVKHPDSPDLFLRAGGHFRSEGMQDTSFMLYKKVIDMAPGDPDGYRELAQYFLVVRSYDSARYYAERAILLDGGSLDSRLLKARALSRSYQYGESIDEYNEILRLDPDHAIAREELTKLKNKIAYLRDIRRIQEQKKDMTIIKIPESKKLKP
jgi:tetratricopeptide (TPR) repeat protein